MTGTPRQDAALVQKFLTHFGGGDPAAVGASLVDDVVDRHLGFEAASAQAGAGAYGCRFWRGADLDLEIDDVVATDDRVSVCAAVGRTHRESLMDLAPTGRSFEIVNAWFRQADSGRVAEIRTLPDGLGHMQRGSGPRPTGSGADRYPSRPGEICHDIRYTKPCRNPDRRVARGILPRRVRGGYG